MRDRAAVWSAVHQRRVPTLLWEYVLRRRCPFVDVFLLAYMCLKCKLLDGKRTDDQIFHCDKCMICRVGRKVRTLFGRRFMTTVVFRRTLRTAIRAMRAFAGPIDVSLR